MQSKPYYITTAIPYSSQKPHLGNTYDAIMADALARYKRQRGFDVFFMTGTDEHGLKIETNAREAGITPQQYADSITGQLRTIWDMLEISYDKFIRTTDDYHRKAVVNIFDRLLAQDDIYRDYYEGWYCVPCESFFTETQLGAGNLCPDCGRAVEKTREEAYFLRLTKYARKLADYIEENPAFISPESRRREMVNNFIKPGLQDLCVTRSSCTWGIPVSTDPRHIIYVWIDALTNYITGLGYDPANETQPDSFNKYWPAQVHIIGKDVVRFHTIYWPVVLMALDLPLPECVFGHSWFTFNDEKMSKSRGNVIYADDLARHFGVDAARYVSLSEMHINDGNITYGGVISRCNNDLANILGNLVSRTIAMTVKYFAGVVPSPAETESVDNELRGAAYASLAGVEKYMDEYKIPDALDELLGLFRRANKYIDETTPWILARDPAGVSRLGTVIYNLLEAIRWGAVLLEPFIPGTSAKILGQLGTSLRGYDSIGKDKFGALESGITVRESGVLFARIDEEKKLAEILAEQSPASNLNKTDNLKAAAPASNLNKTDNPKAAAPASNLNKTDNPKAAAAASGLDKTDNPKAAVPASELNKTDNPKAAAPVPEGLAQIDIGKFMEIEIRTAKVCGCEKVPKAKKLLKLQLDLGYETRQVVSGIAKFYEPADLIGRKVAVVANLSPATICGIESRGMILASGEEQVRVVFLADDTPLGERIR